MSGLNSIRSEIIQHQEDTKIEKAEAMALPNLRRLFVEARTEAEENEYSRNAFYNLVLFISSVAVFSLVAQRMSGAKNLKA